MYSPVGNLAERAKKNLLINPMFIRSILKHVTSVIRKKYDSTY